MRTRYSEDQLAVDEMFAGFFANESPTTRIRAAAALGHDPDLWSKLAETGAPGMALPATVGGGDASLLDLAVAVRQQGRHIAASPLVEHAVAGRLLADLRAEDELMGDIVSGHRIATLTLRPVGDGRARLVPAGAVADVVVGIEGDNLLVSSEPAPGRARPNTADLPLADRDMTGATPIATGSPAEAAWNRARAEWKALTAVAYTGLAARVLDMTVDYAMERHQFDVPIGSFQAVQHGLADAATRIEGAILLANRATWALTTAAEGGERLASMALLFAAETARHAADRALQYHGGYGFAEESDVQLYYRRAAGWILQLGDPADEYAWLSDQELGPRTGRGAA